MSVAVNSSQTPPEAVEGAASTETSIPKSSVDGTTTRTRSAVYTLLGAAIAVPSWLALVAGEGHGTGLGQAADFATLAAGVGGAIATIKHGFDAVLGKGH